MESEKMQEPTQKEVIFLMKLAKNEEVIEIIAEECAEQQQDDDAEEIEENIQQCLQNADITKLNETIINSLMEIVPDTPDDEEDPDKKLFWIGFEILRKVFWAQMYVSEGVFNQFIQDWKGTKFGNYLGIEYIKKQLKSKK